VIHFDFTDFSARVDQHRQDEMVVGAGPQAVKRGLVHPHRHAPVEVATSPFDGTLMYRWITEATKGAEIQEWMDGDYRLGRLHRQRDRRFRQSECGPRRPEENGASD